MSLVYCAAYLDPFIRNQMDDLCRHVPAIHMDELHFPTVAAQARVATTNTNGPISQRRSRFVSTPPVGLQNEMVAYEAHPARYDNPLEFWRNNENSFAKLARMCLGVMGSNTPSETEMTVDTASQVTSNKPVRDENPVVTPENVKSNEENDDFDVFMNEFEGNVMFYE
uniref:HAT C-terminal dimerisation domain-containing protein n=1 Tax=Ditylenchus dipsaci TaxID=166011 RepID=A0A915CYE6_9BILA